MKIEERILQHFRELQAEAREMAATRKRIFHVDRTERWSWGKWSTSALNLLEKVFGRDSVPFQNLKRLDELAEGEGLISDKFQEALGIFEGAQREYESGFFTSISTNISGELFGDLVQLAKRCLSEGQKDSAAVVASAALEDVLKRFATLQGLSVKDKSMQDVVGALKSKGLVGGAQKSLLDIMPKIRDYAMHARWDKISDIDVGSMIAFVEQFLISHF
jgi:hypothetical protein